MTETSSARLLQFMVPGFLHGMGNALFTIQAQAQVLNTGPEIVRGCTKAGEVLDVLRLLSDPRSSDGDGPVGPQLRALVDVMRIGMRDAGLSLDAGDEVFAAEDGAPRGTFVHAVALATEGLQRALPTGCQGRVRLRWVEPGALCIEFVADPQQLPFDVDLTETAERLAHALVDTAFGSRRQAEGHGLVLTLPPVGRRDVGGEDV